MEHAGEERVPFPLLVLPEIVPSNFTLKDPVGLYATASGNPDEREAMSSPLPSRTISAAGVSFLR